MCGSKTYPMPIFQYKCNDCSSVFEQLISSLGQMHIDCISCASTDVLRADQPYFYPNKTFCPHDKKIDSDKLKEALGTIMADRTQSCGGCGTDGAPGSCGKSGGGCGSGGGCNNCQSNCKK